MVRNAALPRKKEKEKEDNAARRCHEENLEVGLSCPMALETMSRCEALSAMSLHHEYC